MPAPELEFETDSNTLILTVSLPDVTHQTPEPEIFLLLFLINCYTTSIFLTHMYTSEYCVDIEL